MLSEKIHKKTDIQENSIVILPLPPSNAVNTDAVEVY